MRRRRLRVQLAGSNKPPKAVLQILAQEFLNWQTRRHLARRNHYLLSGLVQCTCGARVDGGYYRCRARCGRRSIKRETLEEAVMASLFAEILTAETLYELKEEIEKELRSHSKGRSFSISRGNFVGGISLEDRLRQERSAAEPRILRLDDETLADFLTSYRGDLETGEPESKKAILRSVIDRGVFDGETLTINPSYENITGVKLASPRGVEPLLPA